MDIFSWPHLVEQLVSFSLFFRYSGNKDFFFGNTPCETDCVFFGMLAVAYWNLEGSPFHALMTGKTILVIAASSWKCRHVDEIIMTGYAGSCQNGNFAM